MFDYKREFNKDGTEKHVTCMGARYHVISYYLRNGKEMQTCSEPNCEINRKAISDSEKGGS